MTRSLDQARAFFTEGVAHYEAGRLPQAERQFAAALALAPGRPSVLTNLGVVRLKLGRVAEAVDLLQEALRAEPDNLEALAHCALGLAEQGHRQQALALFDRALAIDSRPAGPWMHRGSLLKELGRLDEAAASFRESIARGGDAELNGFYLAALAGGSVPAAPPRAYVEALFDGYADAFDAHLTQALAYQAPRLLTQRLLARPRRYGHALDLGCGTGLCGPYLRQLAGRVTGVELSRNMLHKAEASGDYDGLTQTDVQDFLRSGDEACDLVVAADVFIYVGALDAVFEHVARRMPAGGAFCFTVEEAPADHDFALRASLRYAHSETYLRRLAATHGFAVDGIERHAVREDQQVPVPGLFVWLEKS